MDRTLRAFKWFMDTLLNKDFERPVYGSYKLLHECNLRCPFCNVWKTPMKALDTNGAMRVIDRLADSTVTVLSLEGGEPLLRKDLLEIVKHAYERSFYLFLQQMEYFFQRPLLKNFQSMLILFTYL
jgi:Predicted Fe-S oxidoreductases